MTRAERRAQTARAKQKTRRVLGRLPRLQGYALADDPRRVGIWTSTHRCPCSCAMCDPHKGEGKRIKFKGYTKGALPEEE